MRGDTAIGHVDAHNELRSGVLREAERFGVTVDLGGPYKVGDPGHIQEHNKTRAALDLLAKTAGVTVTLPDEHRVGDTGHAPHDHDLLDQALAVISKADAWNDATGGTITTYTKPDKTVWRVHTFTGSGTLVVNRAVRPFRVLVVGGGTNGGGGGPYCKQGDPGASGEPLDKTQALAVGSLPITAGGSQPTTFAGITARAGTNSPGIASDITGSSVNYPGPNGGPGACGSPGQPGSPGTWPGGAGGGGGGIGNSPPYDAGPGGAGASGGVIVSYQIGVAS